MKLVSVHFPEHWIRQMNELVNKGQYPNKSELIRHAVRDLLKTEVWLNNKHQTQLQGKDGDQK